CFGGPFCEERKRGRCVGSPPLRPPSSPRLAHFLVKRLSCRPLIWKRRVSVCELARRESTFVKTRDESFGRPVVFLEAVFSQKPPLLQFFCLGYGLGVVSAD